ncbi:hypothetical protein [Gemmatimonas sp.]|uniref:hypothetical protein n=1 Tax=Gemmatimonas sp. TaxID=1962908 RepID=UPI00286D807E|nr:hypothetical protein [Gemmatimonas sp.]
MRMTARSTTTSSATQIRRLVASGTLIAAAMLTTRVAAAQATTGASVTSAARVGAARDSADAMATFRENIAAIHTRNKPRYLATYVHTPQLVRHSPTALETGYEGWPAITESAWPDTLIVKEMRVVPVAPGVVYGYYRYIGVPAPGDTLTGVSTRVFVRTPVGMRITVTASWNDAPPVTKR